MDGLLDGRNLLHHLLVDSQTSGCIDNHQIVTFCLCFRNSMLGNFYRILIFFFQINRHTNLFGQYPQLLDSGRTINVAGNQQRLLVFLGLQHIGQLTGERSLTRTLQTRHQDDCRTTFQIQFSSGTTHQLSQFVVYDLNHQLARLNRSQHILSQGFFFYLVGKCLGNLIIDIGIQQGTTYIL